MRFCGAELKPFWLHVNEQPASSKRQLLVSRPRLFKTAKLIRSSAKRSATTKFLNRSAHEQDDTRALGEFRQAEQGLPNSADVIEAIALKQRLRGHWDEAVAELRRAIELDPRNITASNNLALTYCAMRRFPEALATLDRILAWDPTNARALLTKAEALIAIGDLQAAEPLL